MQPSEKALSKYRLERASFRWFDASKHSSVIARFNQYHVHIGNFEKGTYKIIDSAYRIREKCDYSDFFIVSKEEALAQYEKAVEFLKCVEEFFEE